jgi:metal-responsive CopG/Arc/MetJ family transcriptional regulator
MKTAMSIPDPLFQAADKVAKQLGVSRSELYSNAVEKFVEAYQRELDRKKLEEVYSEDDSEPDKVLSALQWLAIDKEDW